MTDAKRLDIENQKANERQLDLFKNYTELELTTAQQLCLERNRDSPNDKDMADAVKMCARWNRKRIDLELKPWK